MFQLVLTLRSLAAPAFAALAFAALILASATSDSAAAPAPSGAFVGTWTMEQIPPGGAARRQGTLTVTRSGDALAGTMRVGGTDVPLSNVRESGGIISFSTTMPGSPGLVLNYSGAIRGNELGVASQDFGSGSYTLTARRAGGAAQAQAKTAPAAPPRAAAAPRAPAATASAPPALGAPGSAAQGDYVGRLLGQASPEAAPAASPPPRPPQVVASAPPPARSVTPRAPARPPAEPPPEPGPSLEGSWSGEQTTPASAGPSAATLSFTREGNRVAGVLRSEGQEFPLFDMKQAGAELSFSVVVPGMPYETILYSGRVVGDRLELEGLGENQRAYALKATKQEPSPSAPPQIASETPPAEPAPAPQVALAPPPLAGPEPTPAPAAEPLPVPAPLASAGTSVDLQGTWSAELTDPGAPSSIPATLSFDGDKATMHVGADALPLYDLTQMGIDVSFTVIVPGSPYVSVRYSGVVTDDTMQLASLDNGRGVSTLMARRVERSGSPAADPLGPMQASLAPPAATRTVPRPPVGAGLAPRTPSPPSALPLAQAPAAVPSGPPTKLPLPALRDLPPNGLAATPPMGWSSRQKLGSRTDDAAIRQAVEGLVESGLNLVGYTYVEIGDGWQGARDLQGVLHPNERFPDMKALGDYIHSQGLKFGLTAAVAPRSCNGFQGSYGYETQDARTFAEWGVDYVVFEWCSAEGFILPQDEMRAAFQMMGEGLRASGRDIVYGVSQKGPPIAVEQWAARTGANMWRIGGELEENWASVAAAGFAQNGREVLAKPGAWNDPGLLQTGNSAMTADESRMQINLWAVLAAPLMLGNDVRIMTRETVALLSNREVIAVNQDKMGRQGKRVARFGDTQVWARPLADGSLAVAFFNTGARTTSVAVTWAQLGIEGPRLARDLWWHENLGIANTSYTVVLAGGTSMLVTLAP